jgi:16S rRNA processing protein RimM
MLQSDELILLGKVVAVHGVRGQLRIFLFSGVLDTIAGLETITFKEPGGKTASFAVTKAVRHGKKVLLSLKDFDTVNQVARLAGREIFIRREQLPAPAEGEYYWIDLIGLVVETDLGEPLGILSDIIVTGSNDVYVVKGNDREYLIPALEEVVIKIDLATRVMVVSPPEGLFDL